MYSAEIDGQPTEFGTSGLLYRSNKLMYDRATETLWHQFRGEPVVGPLAGSGLRLKILPSVLTTWEEWRAAHPDTSVISRETGIYPAEFYRPESHSRSIYHSYRDSRRTMFPVAMQSKELPVKAPIFGLAFGDAARAYPRSLLAERPLLHDAVGGQEAVIIGSAGGAVRAYQCDGLRFQSLDAQTIRDNQGRIWQITEDALVESTGAAPPLERLPSRDAYWFGWHAFYPHTDIYQP